MEVNEYRLQIAADLAMLKQIATDTLEQTKKTNGRVTKLEDVIALWSPRLAVLEDTKGRTDRTTSWWKDKVGTALIGLALSLSGAFVMLMLQKTHVVDVSVVSADTYDQIDSLTE